MKVKKYTAKTMPEAMAKVRDELGSEAVILNSKQISTGGFLGFFTKNMIEVIAAIDPDIRKNSTTKTPRKQQQPPQERTMKVKQVQVDEKKAIMKEISELKKLIQDVNSTNSQTVQQYPGYLQEIYNNLVQQEVEKIYLLKIMESLLIRWYSENGEAQTKTAVYDWTKHTLRKLLEDKSYGPFQYNKRFLNVVGPTGVGKTTTLAKIAAKAAIEHGKKVAFITTDTYRISAIDQLKTYAKILNVPVEVAYSIKDFTEAKEKLNDYDLILVDSAGRNFRNPEYVDQLREVIDFDNEMETHLVLALTSKYGDMKKIVEQFARVTIHKIIFTKLDETESYGAMLNIPFEFNVGASYLTTGQNVPDDIDDATHELVIDRVVRS
ncbi:flagellar biosynthesis protein FlhF [Evansella sp. AB-rgal1]|uniref:flagellar biosynthesis protein FlhF n=1 Tax=Evansella sp. AB-rgal1 TaxID=3242696 RepID=UPI00359CCDE7